MLLKCLVSFVVVLLAGCSNDRARNGEKQEITRSCKLVPVCREESPGVFKEDYRKSKEACDPGEPYENEVPNDYCAAGAKRQQEITREVDAIEQDLSSCQVDTDCKVVEVTPSCGFSCGLAVNLNADLSKRNRLVEEYNSYTMCRAKECAPPVPGFVGPRCEKGHCVSVP